MPSFNSLYTVRSGLYAAQRALEVIGQNVSNASTVGYSRQEVSLAASEPSQVIKAGGRGISDVNVLRYRDEFLDRQWRSRTGSQSYYGTRSSQLSQVEHIVGDLSEGGLRTALDEFFNSWQNLSLRPADAGARVQVVSAAEDLLDLAKTSFNDLAQLRLNMDEAIRNKVSEVNNATGQLAELNQAIVNGELNQQQANQLRDQRDKLIDSIAKLAGVTTVPQADGTISVHLGSLPLVDKATAYSIDATIAQEADMDPDLAIVSTRQFTTTLTWNGTTNQAKFQSGELGSLLELRDQVIPGYMKYLDNLVRTVATNVNTAHNAGVPVGSEVDIFDIQPDWMSIQVNSAVKADPSLILAAATLPAVDGDGERARAIAALLDAPILTGAPVGTRTVTAGEYLRSVHTAIGLDTQQAVRRSEAADLQVEQAEKQRQSVSGVSLDDEMTKMIQYQQAYNAAGRMMTAIDEMLDAVINRVGIVGR